MDLKHVWSDAYTINVAIGAPITEEPAKALILVLLIRAKRFNNICDGFVFGAAAGLGFWNDGKCQIFY